MPKYKVMSGNYAIAYGAALSRVELVSAYPITPQTSVVEKLSEMIETDKLRAKLVRVESEHSALAACVGGSHRRAGYQLHRPVSGCGSHRDLSPPGDDTKLSYGDSIKIRCRAVEISI